MKLALITPSFSRDRDLCAALCATVDRFNRDGLEHIVVVPRRETPLFAPLAGPHRRIVAKEAVLPPIRQLPLPTRVGIPGIAAKRLRSVWVTPSLRPVRGWILQQIVKLSADRLSDADGFVFVDSDIAFVRPFGVTTFVTDGKLALLHEPGVIDRTAERYRAWHAVAHRLLGLPPTPYDGDNFVGPLVAWRRDRLMETTARIGEVSGEDFRRTLMGLRQLSEYVVYGIAMRHVAGNDSGHVLTDRSLALCDWHHDLTGTDGRAAFVEALAPHHVAVLIQSTQEWTMSQRNQLVGAVERHAAATDAR